MQRHAARRPEFLTPRRIGGQVVPGSVRWTRSERPSATAWSRTARRGSGNGEPGVDRRSRRRSGPGAGRRGPRRRPPGRPRRRAPRRSGPHRLARIRARGRRRPRRPGRAWLSRRRANRCWLCPPALVRPCTCRWPTLEATTRSVPTSRRRRTRPCGPAARPRSAAARAAAAANAAGSAAPSYPRSNGSAHRRASRRRRPPARSRPVDDVERRGAVPGGEVLEPARQPVRRHQDVRSAGHRRSAQTLKPRARSISRPSSVILSGTPRRHPDPVDRDVVDEALERLVGLVGDHVGQRAGRRGQRHVEDDVVGARRGARRRPGRGRRR